MVDIFAEITHRKGICRSCKSLYPISHTSVSGSDPRDHGQSSGGSIIFLRASAEASNNPTLFPCISVDQGILSKGAQSSFFHLTQFFSLSRITPTVSANALPFGVVWRSSSMALFIVSCTHWTSADSKVNSIWSERLRAEDHKLFAAFVKVKRWLRRINS